MGAPRVAGSLQQARGAGEALRPPSLGILPPLPREAPAGQVLGCSEHGWGCPRCHPGPGVCWVPLCSPHSSRVIPRGSAPCSAPKVRLKAETLGSPFRLHRDPSRPSTGDMLCLLGTNVSAENNPGQGCQSRAEAAGSAHRECHSPQGPSGPHPRPVPGGLLWNPAGKGLGDPCPHRGHLVVLLPALPWCHTRGTWGQGVALRDVV